MSSVIELVSRLRHDDQAAVSRAISLVENAAPGFEQLLVAIHHRLGQAHRVGVTGPPGAGKSTLTAALATIWRAEGWTVAVVAVDPTSPLTGGALLGDRIRMEGVTLDPGVFIRSMATRGALGGLAVTTREVCDVLDAAGFDRIVIETVGVGQSELEVVSVADTVVLVMTPESGDGIQTLKSGLIEVADLFVVNKADRPGAERLLKELEFALHLGRRSAEAEGEWSPPVLLASASAGEGVAELGAAIARHSGWLRSTGRLAIRRGRRLAAQTLEVVERAIRQWGWDTGLAQHTLSERRADVEAGRLTPYDVAAEVRRRLEGKQ
jgi:LAO/AO transport system kinase